MAHPARGRGRQQLVYRRRPADAGRRGGPAQQLIVFATTCPYKGAFLSAFFYEQPPVSSAANRVVLTGNMRLPPASKIRPASADQILTALHVKHTHTQGSGGWPWRSGCIHPRGRAALQDIPRYRGGGRHFVSRRP